MQVVESQLCGCTGCASCDPGDIFTPWTQRMIEYKMKMEGWKKAQEEAEGKDGEREEESQRDQDKEDKEE